MDLTLYGIPVRLWCYFVVAFVLTFIVLRVIVKRFVFVRGLAAIPGPPGIPVLGNSLSLTGGQEDFFRLLVEYRKRFGSIFKLWVGTRPFVFISDAQYVGPILNSSLHIDKSYEYTFLHPWLGTGLLTATGSKWHNRRKLLTPTFHYSLLDDFVEPIIRKSEILVDRLEGQVNQTPFNVLNYTKLCALDIICVTAMGKDVNAQLYDGTDYVRAVDGLNKILQRRFITPWLKPDFVFERCSLGKQQKKFIRTINDFVSRVIEERKTELSKGTGQSQEMDGAAKQHRAFLDLLLQVAESDSLTDDDIREEVNTFMFAGHDTTSVAISWCLYALGKHPAIQQKILDEYESTIGAEVPSYKSTQKLEYLENCIKETLRLYPVVPLIARDIKHEVRIDSKKRLLPGVTALIFTPSLHRDANVFENPDEFQPARFSDKKTRNPFSYIPFSAGPRNCIGAKFAMMQIKIVIYYILKRFQIISVDSEKDLNLMSEIVLSNKEGIRIVLKRRQNLNFEI